MIKKHIPFNTLYVKLHSTKSKDPKLNISERDILKLVEKLVCMHVLLVQPLHTKQRYGLNLQTKSPELKNLFMPNNKRF